MELSKQFRANSGTQVEVIRILAPPLVLSRCHPALENREVRIPC